MALPKTSRIALGLRFNDFPSPAKVGAMISRTPRLLHSHHNQFPKGATSKAQTAAGLSIVRAHETEGMVHFLTVFIASPSTNATPLSFRKAPLYHKNKVERNFGGASCRA